MKKILVCFIFVFIVVGIRGIEVTFSKNTYNSTFEKSNSDFREKNVENYLDSLVNNFKNPPISAKPHTWWHWINGHISMEAITKELEAMKNVGLGGFTLFNSDTSTPLAGPVEYMSDEWYKMIEYTISEADRLGLEMRIHNGAGWSASGGPWITPNKAMQEIVWTELYVSGPKHINEVIEIPEPALGIERDMRKDPKKNERFYVSREDVRGFYNDIAVLAFPTLKTDLENDPFRLESWRSKAGFSKINDIYKINNETMPAGASIQLDQILDLTSFLTKDGKLCWDVPEGDWTIMRFGYQPTGRKNHPAPESGTGLETDKLSSSATDLFWKYSVNEIINIANRKNSDVFKGVIVDSYEAGHQNWNSSFAQDFMLINGYDITKYLPAITGKVVESVDETERFLWDYRKTLSDLIIKNYYGRFSELCKYSGLTFSAEPYGTYGNTDDFSVAIVPDIPMAEWWTFTKNSSQLNTTAKLASSAAHTQGRKIVDSEAFTGSSDRIFEEHPYALKKQGDFFYTQGINRFSMHTFTHNPYNYPPGFGLGTYGSRIDPGNTWWPFVGAWFKYLARCQYILQQGQFVADILYYVGDDAPKSSQIIQHILPALPKGYDYDFCTSKTLMQVEVENSNIILPSGMSYKILVLPESEFMTPEVLNKIKNIVSSGGNVVGGKPLYLPGLSFNDQEKEFNSIANVLWKDVDNHLNVCEYGKGKIYNKTDLELVFSDINLLPDFSYRFLNSDDTEDQTDLYEGLEYIHRRIEDTDIYLISNQDSISRDLKIFFRIENMLPELWNPDNGSIEYAVNYRAETDKRMSVNLEIDPYGSLFVVFRQPIKNESNIISVLKDNKSAEVQCSNIHIELNAPWDVSFPLADNKTKTVKFFTLMPWDKHEDLDIKYFSGIATYSYNLDVTENLLSNDKINILDLGDVKVIAEVYVNGINQGIAWKAPFQVNITNSLKLGDNKIEIRVANLWVNRLIGDEQYEDDCEWTSETRSSQNVLALKVLPDWLVNDSPRPTPRSTFVTIKWPHIKNKKLLSSGLIGPVKLFSQVRKK